jgi:hypothetical protein
MCNFGCQVIMTTASQIGCRNDWRFITETGYSLQKKQQRVVSLHRTVLSYFYLLAVYRFSSLYIIILIIISECPYRQRSCYKTKKNGKADETVFQNLKPRLLLPLLQWTEKNKFHQCFNDVKIAAFLWAVLATGLDCNVCFHCVGSGSPASTRGAKQPCRNSS